MSAGLRPRRRSRKSGRGPDSRLASLALLVLCATLAFFPTMIAASSPLDPRSLSKRAQPADLNDLAHPLRKRQSANAGISSDHNVQVTISQPRTCAPLNITWDPTKGTPPFTLAVFAELWFPLVTVSIPATYADTSLRQWLYQIDLPQFQDGPTAVGNNPSIIAAIVDSTGQMANTSNFLTVDNSDISCARQPGSVEFNTWSEGGPVQCNNWSLGWNVSGTAFKGPMVPFILPQEQPPILLDPPDNYTSSDDGTGGMQWQVSVPYGSYIVYSISDAGTGGTGGVGGKNLVGLDQYAGHSCAAQTNAGLPTPTMTASVMTVTPDYTTRVTTTSNGAILTVETLVRQGHSDAGISPGSIAGIAVGIAVAVGLILALILWLFYKRSQKKRETHWEIPGGGSNYPKGMPIDRSLAAQGFTGGSRATTAAGPMRASATQSFHGSFRSLGSSAGSAFGYDVPRQHEQAALGGDSVNVNPFGSPPTPPYLNMAPYSDNSPVSTDPGVFSRSPSSPQQTRGSGADQLHNIRDEREVLMGDLDSSSSPGMAFGSGGGPLRRPSVARSAHVANAYRSALGRPVSAADGYEEVQLNDRYPPSSSQLPASASVGSGNSSSGTYGSGSSGSARGILGRARSSSGGFGGGGGGTTPAHTNSSAAAYRSPTMAHQQVVVHSDAGLLLDDSISEDGVGFVELPPQYDSIPVRATRDRERERGARAQARAQVASPPDRERQEQAGADGAGAHPQGAHQPERSALDELVGDGDDDVFWRR